MLPAGSSILIFLQLAVMLAAAVFCGHLARRIKIPAVIGEIFGGILLGPSLLGQIAPDLYQALFPVSAVEQGHGRDAIIKLGMVFFLFVTGTEINLGFLKKKSRAALWTSLLGIAIPFGTGCLIVFLFPQFWQPHTAQSLTHFALFLGTALSISALPVISRILMDLGLIRTEFGTLVLSTATVDDLIGWSLFSLLLAHHTGNSFESFGVLIPIGLILLAGMAFIFRRWAQRQEESEANITDAPDLMGPTIVMILIAGALARFFGMHAVFGGFLLGIILGRIPASKKFTSTFREFALNFFAPVYFVSVGMKLNFHLSFNWEITAVIFLIACFGKILGAWLGGILGGLSPRHSLSIGFALNARGAMEIILASAAYEGGMIAESMYIALVVMALLTSLMSGPLIQKNYSAIK